MSGIQPRALSNRELIVYATAEMHDEVGMPLAYQIELLRRFNLLSPLDEYPPANAAQFELFPETK